MQGTNTASAPLLSPAAERQRLESLRRYRILDTLPEAAYDDIVRLARQVCGTPQAVMTFVAEDRQWFKAAEGIEGEETERGIAFCDVAIRRRQKINRCLNKQGIPQHRSFIIACGRNDAHDFPVRFPVGAHTHDQHGKHDHQNCGWTGFPPRTSPAIANIYIQTLPRL